MRFPPKVVISRAALPDVDEGGRRIQQGNVRLSFRSEGGKKATLAILGESDFFGEGGLAGQLVSRSSTTAVTDCVLLHIEKETMVVAMSRKPQLAVTFVQHLQKRILRDKDDLVDQLFNVSEKRLARVAFVDDAFRQEKTLEK